MTKILDVAQYIYDYCKEITGENIDEMKLHKLLYFCQREKLALLDEPMFKESFEGWIHGPVSVSTRSYYDSDSGINHQTDKLDDFDAYIVRNIVLQYGGYASWKLRDMSHKEVSWSKSRKGLLPGQRGSRTLDIEDIREDAQKVRPYDSLWDMYYDEFDDYEEE